MWNTDLHFYASLTFCYFLVPVLVTVMLLGKHFHMGRIILVASPLYGFDLYFCFIDFKIRFTDFLLFLCPKFGYSHDTSQTLSYGARILGTHLHPYIVLTYILCFTDMSYSTMAVRVRLPLDARCCLLTTLVIFSSALFISNSWARLFKIKDVVS